MSARRAKATKSAAPGRPKDPGKGAAILDTAKRLFLALGYEGVSMDQIAADAGVSKLTVYSHFGDKDALFAEAVRAGWVNVNEGTNYWESHLPFGGRAGSQSGVGRVGGRFSMDRLTELKTVVIDLG